MTKKNIPPCLLCHDQKECQSGCIAGQHFKTIDILLRDVVRYGALDGIHIHVQTSPVPPPPFMGTIHVVDISAKVLT